MAVMELSKRMAFWKIELDDEDFTALLREVIQSISVKRTILPPPKNSKKMHAPSEATIEIVSKNYLEDLFVEGTKINIYMGYDRILTEKALVFSGTMPVLPDGSAEEMLKYKVLAFGNEIELALEEKSRTFIGLTKPQIIKTIMAPYTWMNVTVDIDDTVKPSVSYPPLQINKTDFQLLSDFADNWGCSMWLEMPNKFYFIDANKFSKYHPTYYLSYRSDKMPNPNVESVEWKHDSARVGLVDNDGGFTTFGQAGEIKDIENYKIFALGKTWQVKPEILAQIKANPDHIFEVRKILSYIAEKTFKWNSYEALKKYYKVCDDGDNTKKSPPANDDSGMKVTVKLNNGDPDLYPPRQALLYHGSINPRADSSHLPGFLSRWGMEQIWLNINETVLSYNQGRLDSELTCSIGVIKL